LRERASERARASHCPAPRRAPLGSARSPAAARRVPLARSVVSFASLSPPQPPNRLRKAGPENVCVSILSQNENKSTSPSHPGDPKDEKKKQMRKPHQGQERARERAGVGARARAPFFSLALASSLAALVLVLPLLARRDTVVIRGQVVAGVEAAAAVVLDVISRVGACFFGVCRGGGGCVWRRRGVRAGTDTHTQGAATLAMAFDAPKGTSPTALDTVPAAAEVDSVPRTARRMADCAALAEELRRPIWVPLPCSRRRAAVVLMVLLLWLFRIELGEWWLSAATLPPETARARSNPSDGGAPHQRREATFRRARGRTRHGMRRQSAGLYQGAASARPRRLGRASARAGRERGAGAFRGGSRPKRHPPLSSSRRRGKERSRNRTSSA
jgi:hypothetical protein